MYERDKRKREVEMISSAPEYMHKGNVAAVRTSRSVVNSLRYYSHHSYKRKYHFVDVMTNPKFSLDLAAAGKVSDTTARKL